jgi:hypothetical protein
MLRYVEELMQPRANRERSESTLETPNKGHAEDTHIHRCENLSRLDREGIWPLSWSTSRVRSPARRKPSHWAILAKCWSIPRLPRDNQVGYDIDDSCYEIPPQSHPNKVSAIESHLEGGVGGPLLRRRSSKQKHLRQDDMQADTTWRYMSKLQLKEFRHDGMHKTKDGTDLKRERPHSPW